MNQQQIILWQQQQLIHRYQQQHQQQFAEQTQLLNEHRNLQAINLKQQAQIAQLKLEVKSRTIGKQTTAFKDLSRPGRFKRLRDMKQVLAKVLDPRVSQDASSIRVVFSFEDEEDRQIIVRGTGIERAGAEDLQNLQNLHHILNVKDRFRISYRALHALRVEAKICQIPTCRKLLDEAKRLSTSLDIISLSSQTVPQLTSGDGSIRLLTNVIDHILALPENTYIMNTPEDEITITLRFACDGAKITKTKDSVRGVVKLIDHNRCNGRQDSPDDEMTVFLYMGKEDRPTLEGASAITMRQMEEAATTGVQINLKNVKVQWLLCCDWKALALLRGINGANAKYFCPWCLCSKEDITDFSAETTWKTCRNKEQQNRCIAPEAANSYGYQQKDLLHFVPYDQMVPDELHLRMRISNKLLNQVVVWAIDQDNRTALLDEMHRLKIDFKFFEDQGDDGKGKISKWTQLNGDNLEKVLSNLRVIQILDRAPRDIKNLSLLPKNSLKAILAQKTGRNIPTALPKGAIVAELQILMTAEEQREAVANRPRKRSRLQCEGATPDNGEEAPAAENRFLNPEAIQELWDEFHHLMESMIAKPDSPEAMTPTDFHTAARAWAEKLKKETFMEDIIPYIHCMVFHVPEVLHKFKYLKDIGIAQVERKNYDQHLVYFQGTSRHYFNFIAILERENRLLHFRRFPIGEDPELDDPNAEDQQNEANGENSQEEAQDSDSESDDEN